MCGNSCVFASTPPTIEIWNVCGLGKFNAEYWRHSANESAINLPRASSYVRNNYWCRRCSSFEVCWALSSTRWLSADNKRSVAIYRTNISPGSYRFRRFFWTSRSFLVSCKSSPVPVSWPSDILHLGERKKRIRRNVVRRTIHDCARRFFSWSISLRLIRFSTRTPF